MDHSSPGDLLRAYYRALDEPRLDRLPELLAADCDWRFPGTALTSPTAVQESMARSLALGLVMDHQITLLLEEGDAAVCELTATNRLPDATFVVRGAVVCESRDGRIVRLAAYPDAEQLAAFLGGLRDRARSMRAGNP